MTGKGQSEKHRKEAVFYLSLEMMCVGRLNSVPQFSVLLILISPFLLPYLQPAQLPSAIHSLPFLAFI